MKILVGAGGMAIDYLTYNSPAYAVSLIDDEKTGKIMGHNIIGNIDSLISNPYILTERTEVYNCIGSSGDNKARNETYQRLKKVGIKVENMILSSFVANDVAFGENVLTNIGSQIHHGCIIHDNVVISPAAILCGNVIVEDNVFIGAGAIIKQGVCIGKNAIIGAGSVVVEDIPEYHIVAGVPAKFLKYRRDV